MVEVPKDETRVKDEMHLVRGTEWIEVLKAFWRIMSSTFANNGQGKKFGKE